MDNLSTADRIIDAIRAINPEGDVVYVIKYAQSKGKLDSGMRGPYRVVRALDHHRYELKLLAGAYGKTTYAAAQFLVPWKGEWTPETCAAFFENDVDEIEPTMSYPVGLSMPSLKSEEDSSSADVAGPSGITPGGGVEGDTLSGEAVLAVLMKRVAWRGNVYK